MQPGGEFWLHRPFREVGKGEKIAYEELSASQTDKLSSKTLSVSNVIAIGAALTGTAGMHVHVGDDARGVQEWHDIR
jgi:hypothetical protein